MERDGRGAGWTEKAVVGEKYERVFCNMWSIWKRGPMVSEKCMKEKVAEKQW